MLTSIIIGGIAILVLYYLYITLKEYLGNEENQKRFAQEEKTQNQISYEPTLQEKIQMSEYGTLAGILGYVANADGKICLLEQTLANSLLADMANEMFKSEDRGVILDELQRIFSSSKKDIALLTQRFVELTKGEYKKKLKVVEFCFVLGYADGSLNAKTQEAIIDIGALLDLSNEDFNALYDDFAKESEEVIVSQEEAKEIFGDFDDLQKRYVELVEQSKKNLANEENLHSFNGRDKLLELQKIQKAYELLSSK